MSRVDMLIRAWVSRGSSKGKGVVDCSFGPSLERLTRRGSRRVHLSSRLDRTA
jgi:hypothetical protein